MTYQFVCLLLKVGGWSAEFESHSDFIEQSAKDETLVPAFKQSRDMFIELSNTGESRWRSRTSDAYRSRKGGASARDLIADLRSKRKVLARRSGSNVFVEVTASSQLALTRGRKTVAPLKGHYPKQSL